VADFDSNTARQLSRALQDPEFRQTLPQDPRRAFEQAGIQPESIPEEYLKAFSDMTPEELEVLSSVDRKLEATGAKDTTGYVVF
jgi:hypothetical protein